LRDRGGPQETRTEAALHAAGQMVIVEWSWKASIERIKGGKP
jgi:hypothetical protein